MKEERRGEEDTGGSDQIKIQKRDEERRERKRKKFWG